MHAPKNCSVIAVGRGGLPQSSTRLRPRSFDGKITHMVRVHFSQMCDKPAFWNQFRNWKQQTAPSPQAQHGAEDSHPFRSYWDQTRHESWLNLLMKAQRTRARREQFWMGQRQREARTKSLKNATARLAMRRAGVDTMACGDGCQTWSSGSHPWGTSAMIAPGAAMSVPPMQKITSLPGGVSAFRRFQWPLTTSIQVTLFKY